VVEDEVLVRMAVMEHLQDCGFKIVAAGSVDEAIAVLESELEIDLVFTDIQLPGARNGLALAKWIRANRPGIKIILTSGQVGPEELADELCETGPFLSKPYEPQIVASHIWELLGARE
jgi:CheY-like chemotaxis protein